MRRFLRKVNIKLYPQKLFFTPKWIVLGVNNVCNLHCKMCDVGTGFSESNFSNNLIGTRPLNMPLDLLKEIIDQTSHYFPQTKLGYAFTEPLIYPDLIESLHYANKKGLHTAVTTNALTLSKKAEELCEAGLNELFVSLDGPERIHNEIRGNKNSFQKAIEGIKIVLSKAKRPKVSVFCTITEWNTSNLKELADYFIDMPLQQLGFMHTNYTLDSMVEKHNLIYGSKYPATVSNIQETNIPSMDILLLKEEIDRIKATEYTFPISFSPNLESIRMLEIFYKMPEIFIGSRCNDIFNNIMIKSDGTIIPAHGRCYNVPLGNMYNNNLKEIWNSSQAGRFRKDIIDAGGLLPACSRCCSAY